MIQYLYLGRVGYEEGLGLQAEMAALVAAGRLKNVLLLLEHPAVLTLGRNGNRANVLAGDALLAARGVTLHQTNRGGDATYHGPGQLVGYPIFDLRSLRGPSGGRMGPVDFVRGIEEALIRVCAGWSVIAGRVAGLTGVWCGTNHEQQGPQNEEQSSGMGRRRTVQSRSERKIGAIGIHVAKGITSHGFAFNLTTNLRDFELIIPCGIADRAVTSLQHELDLIDPGRVADTPELETVADQVGRQFGMVFGEQVLAAGSLEAMRGHACATREFPAEDTPAQAPPEVERLVGSPERPVKA